MRKRRHLGLREQRVIRIFHVRRSALTPVPESPTTTTTSAARWRRRSRASRTRTCPRSSPPAADARAHGEGVGRAGTVESAADTTQRAELIQRLVHTPTGVRLQVVRRPEMRGILDRVADWRTQSKNTLQVSPPPHRIVDDLLADPNPPLPERNALTNAPFFGRDGQRVDRQGYDATTKRYLDLPASLQNLPIPERPSEADVAKAVAVIDDLLCDFDLVSDADRAHAFTMALDPFVRPMLDDIKPLYVVTATVRGTPGLGPKPNSTRRSAACSWTGSRTPTSTTCRGSSTQRCWRPREPRRSAPAGRSMRMRWCISLSASIGRSVATTWRSAATSGGALFRSACPLRSSGRSFAQTSRILT